MIVLVSSDGKTYQLGMKGAMQSLMLKPAIETINDDSPIHLPNVTGKILSMIVEYLKKHYETPENVEVKVTEKDLRKFDAQFLKLEQATLFDLIRVCFLFAFFISRDSVRII